MLRLVIALFKFASQSVDVMQTFWHILDKSLIVGQKSSSDTGNRTPICSVRANRDSHYTISEIVGNSDTGNRTPICSVRANRDSHYTISEISVCFCCPYNIFIFIDGRVTGNIRTVYESLQNFFFSLTWNSELCETELRAHHSGSNSKSCFIKHLVSYIRSCP